MKSLIIANPVGGSFNKNIFEKAVKILEKKIGTINIVYTEYAGHATVIAAKSEAYIIMCAGGDGVINEVVNGIEGKDCVFYPLPFGTANVFCREHNIPVNPLKAAKEVTFDNFQTLYLGKISNKYFVQMVGFGYDADAVRNTNLAFKKKFGFLAYIKSGLEQLIKNNPEQFIFFNKGRKVLAYHAIFAVGKRYAGYFNLAKSKKEDKLLVCYNQKNTRLSLIKTILLMVMNLGFGGKIIESEAIKIVGPSYCQLDGDVHILSNTTNFIVINKASFMLAK